jgi:hypothetical protein
MAASAVNALVGPEAGVFLVRDARHDHIAAQAGACRHRRRDQHGGHAGFHVVGSAPEHFIPLDSGADTVHHALETYRINVPVQHNGRAAARTLPHAHHAGAARRALEPVRLSAAIRQPRLHEPRHVDLAGTRWHERRIDGFDLNEFFQQLHHFTHDASDDLENTLEIGAVCKA